jgi:hypothetical protein
MGSTSLLNGAVLKDGACAKVGLANTTLIIKAEEAALIKYSFLAK